MEQNVASLTVYERAWAWFEANKKQVAWGAGIVVVVGVIVAYYLWSRGERDVSAGEALSHALTTTLPGAGHVESADALLKVAAGYPGTSAGARALLDAAGTHFTQGKYAEAQAEFQKFNRDYSDSPFRSEAMLGVAACLDAQGKKDEAARAYKELVDRHPGETVVPQAKFALARIYESQNKLKEARELYGSIVKDSQRAPSYNSIVGEARVKTAELRSKQPPPASVSAPTETPSFPILSTQPASKTAKTNAP